MPHWCQPKFTYASGLDMWFLPPTPYEQPGSTGRTWRSKRYAAAGQTRRGPPSPVPISLRRARMLRRGAGEGRALSSSGSRGAASGLGCHSHENRWRTRRAQNTRGRSRAKTRTQQITYSTGLRPGARAATPEDAHPGGRRSRRRSRLRETRPRALGTRTPRRGVVTRSGATHVGRGRPYCLQEEPARTQRGQETTRGRVPVRSGRETPRLAGLSPTRPECASG